MGKWLPEELSKIRRVHKRSSIRKKQSKLVREYILNAKLGGCQLCGYNKCLAAIEFHHNVGVKEFEISNCGNRSVRQIADEISKCIVICANCHREVHEGENGHMNGGGYQEKTEDNQIVMPFLVKG